jgi:hypothetical protein
MAPEPISASYSIKIPPITLSLLVFLVSLLGKGSLNIFPLQQIQTRDKLLHTCVSVSVYLCIVGM